METREERMPEDMTATERQFVQEMVDYFVPSGARCGIDVDVAANTIVPLLRRHWSGQQERLLRAAQDVLNSHEGSAEDGTAVVDAEEFSRLNAVIREISDDVIMALKGASR